MVDVVILPGLDGTGRLLESFCGALQSHGIRATAIGYPRDAPAGYDELESHVRARLPQSGRFLLMGESFSGPLAIRIGADPPPGLAGLVLSTTFAQPPLAALKHFAPLVRFAPARPPIALLSWFLLGKHASAELRATLSESLHSVSGAVLRVRAAAALRADASSLLDRISVPVLNLVGSEDRLLFRSASRQLAERLVHGKTLSVAGPHLLLQTHAEQCARHVADFLSELEPGN